MISIALLISLLGQFDPPAGGGSSSSASSVNGAQTAPASVTTAPMAMYVNCSTGSDSAAGTSGAPFLTIQKAFNAVPKNVYHAVDINVVTGACSGAVLDGVTVHQAASASLATVYPYVSLNGTQAAVTPATGTAAGTLSAFSAFSFTTSALAVATDSTQTWTVNDLKGKYLVVTGGTGLAAATVGTPAIYAIISNTSTALTIIGTPSLDNTTTYSIQDNLASVTTPTLSNTSTANPLNLAYTTGSIVYQNCVGLGFSIFKMKFTLGTSNPRGVVLGGTGRVRVFGSNFIGGTGAVSAVIEQPQQAQGTVSLAQVYSIMPTSATAHVDLRNNATGTWSGTAQIGPAYFESGAVGLLTAGNFSIAASTVFESQTAAGLSDQGPGFSGITNARFHACAVGVLVLGTNATGGSPGSAIGMQNSDISNSTTAGVQVTGIASSINMATGFGTTNALGIQVAKGGRVQVGSGVTLTGTSEISVDGVTTSLTLMRANVPKTTVINNYGSLVYE